MPDPKIAAELMGIRAEAKELIDNTGGDTCKVAKLIERLCVVVEELSTELGAQQ